MSIKKILVILAILILAIIIFVVLRKKTNDDVSSFTIGEAPVSSVSTYLKESFPVEVGVLVEGELPDTCTTLGDVVQNKDGEKSFSIRLETKRPLDAVCAEMLTPFSTDITLEGTNGIVAGEYSVWVNGVEGTFTLDVDNFISLEDPLK